MSGTIDSEDDLIRTYLAPLARSHEGAFGLRDDCAIFKPEPGTELVVTTDAVAAGVHFFADDRPEDIAWKALAVNVSDLAAKAATPRVYQMALSFPDAPARGFMQRFAAGLAEAQAAFGIVLSGGDTDRRPGPMTITITAIGEIPTGLRLTRDGARPGDALYVTGTLGDAACGLKLRRGDAEARAWRLASSDEEHLVRRYLRPGPRLAIAPLLRRYATSAMDLSDGLAKDLGRLCAASGTGAIIERSALPLSPAAGRLARSDPRIETLILSGGDDYEILFSAPAESGSDIVRMAAAAGVPIAHIGSLSVTPGLVLRTSSGDQPLDPAGWDHFG